MSDKQHEAAKPDSPKDLEKPAWKFVGRKVLREFSEDQCTDQAAALTYYAVLALFPALLALISILGVIGQTGAITSAFHDIVKPLVSAKTFDLLDPVVKNLTKSQSAGVTLIIGILGALWSASGYVGAFSRAMNRIYEIEEGRPFWKLRPVQLLVTLIAILLSALVLVALVVSGKLADTIGKAIGLGSTAVTVWNIAKFPVIAVIVMLVVALLYYATPNVKQPKFKWISVGAVFAIVIWVVVSIAFAFYVSHFSSYNKTYGSLAGVVVTLLWLWLTNLALLLGAEIDSELERGRELQAGMPAEEELQLPPRDTRNIEKAREKEQQDIERGRAIRERADTPTEEREDSRRWRDQAVASAPAGPEERNTMGKITMLAAGGVGYVLGARAGRQRYEQIRSTALRVRSNPTVQQTAGKAAEAAKQAAPVVKEKVTDAASAAGSKLSSDDSAGPSTSTVTTSSPTGYPPA